MKVVGYMVTAARAADPRGFRRCGRWFEVGVPTKVDATALTTVQAEFLACSNPRDLVVEKIFAPAPAAAPPRDTGVIVTAQADASKDPGDSGVIITAQAEVETAPAIPSTKKGRGK